MLLKSNPPKRFINKETVRFAKGKLSNTQLIMHSVDNQSQDISQFVNLGSGFKIDI